MPRLLFSESVKTVLPRLPILIQQFVETVFELSRPSSRVSGWWGMPER